MDTEVLRALEQMCADTLGVRRVLVMNGPRQSGKTTLARRLVDAERNPRAVRSLDDPTLLAVAKSDPVTFISDGPRPLVIDEVQRAGESLVLAIKCEVDSHRTPGQFILTGSADFLTVPTISESLAGRASIRTVWPFTQGEIAGHPETWIDRAFTNPSALTGADIDAVPRAELVERVVRGGFPEVQQLSGRHRRQWFADYLETVIRRDIVELGGIRRTDQIRRMLALFAARSGSEVVMQSILNDLEIQRQAAWSYASWLRTAFLVHEIPPWSTNPTARITKRPKTFVTDSGLAAFLLGRDENALREPTSTDLGPLVETFVANELVRAATWSSTAIRVHHLRRQDQMEIDLVLEADDGRLVAVEVKAGQTVTARSFRNLARLREERGDAFVTGVVLYTGREPVRFGDRLVALPIPALWS